MIQILWKVVNELMNMNRNNHVLIDKFVDNGYIIDRENRISNKFNNHFSSVDKKNL